jgi:hypothetical protein
MKKEMNLTSNEDSNGDHHPVMTEEHNPELSFKI